MLPELGAFGLIFAGPAAWFNRMVLTNRLLVWVGLISFPLYLWHWPLLSFARIVESETPAIPYRAAALMSSVLLAWLTYHFLEKPIRASNQDRLKITALSILMAILGLFGFISFKNKGFPDRAAAKVASMNVWNNYAFAGTCSNLTHGSKHDDWCNMGNAPEKSPTHILVGDSIGNAYSPMLQAYAEQQNASINKFTPFVFRQFGRGGCPMLFGIGPEHCRSITNAASAYIAQTPSIHTVILSSNWPLYFHGSDWDAQNTINGKQFQTAFEATVAYYQGLGKRVIVFLAPPVGATPRACLVRPLRLTQTDNCKFPRVEADENDGDYRPYLFSYLKSKRIDTFDPFPYLCDSQQCKVTDGTHIYYLDHEHFSLFGSQYLATQAGSDLHHLLTLAPSK